MRLPATSEVNIWLLVTSPHKCHKPLHVAPLWELLAGTVWWMWKNSKRRSFYMGCNLQDHCFQKVYLMKCKSICKSLWECQIPTETQKWKIQRFVNVNLNVNLYENFKLPMKHWDKKIWRFVNVNVSLYENVKFPVKH